MTVTELIQLLETFDGNMEVVHYNEYHFEDIDLVTMQKVCPFEDSDARYWDWGCDEHSDKDTKIVVAIS